MAQQHYDGKKHKKNAARADLLEQLGKTLDMGEMKGTEHCWHPEILCVLTVTFILFFVLRFDFFVLDCNVATSTFLNIYQ